MLNSLNWINSKKYASFAPHEYIVISKLNEENSKLIKDFIKNIYTNGYIENRWKKNWIYLNLEGYKYWCFAIPLNQDKVSFIHEKKNNIMSLDEYAYNCCEILNRVKI